jgi:DNA recombination protein RmuC
LSEQLAGVALGQAAVKAEAGKIVAALRTSSKASGAWGEAQLRNVLDMAGLREGIDFNLQASTTDAEGQRRRPDAVLKLPGGRELVVDSKCSLADYLSASEAESEADRQAALKRHALSVRTHAKGLAEKAYWKEFAQSADFVVMFLPGENFLSAALEQDLDLLSWALDQRILLAGPTNLLAIARVVAMVWRQEKMADEARAIGELGAQLYAALATMTEHVNRVGRNIGEAASAYNDFIGSLEANVLPKARRFPELGVDKGKKPLPDTQPVEKTLRLVQAPELKRIDGA